MNRFDILPRMEKLTGRTVEEITSEQVIERLDTPLKKSLPGSTSIESEEFTSRVRNWPTGSRREVLSAIVSSYRDRLAFYRHEERENTNSETGEAAIPTEVSWKL